MENNIWNKSLKQLYALGVFAYGHDYKMCITFDLVGGILQGFQHFVSLINVFKIGSCFKTIYHKYHYQLPPPGKLDIKRREPGILFISLPIVSLFKLAIT